MGNFPRESLDRLVHFRREMEKILREFFEAAGEDVPGGYSANITADVFETEGEIKIQAEMPGFANGDIRIEFERDAVVIEGSKREEQPGGKVNYVCMERAYGQFRRLIELPAPCDTRRAEARYAKGILMITIPRVKERRGQRQEVKIAWEEQE
ncbi:MAG: Hsp20/alpha crystallin family protein [Deltaproteobacteria bacterium]|nr:Hsp20/alpha crystallin family protein [Deltaproteobacteria bacterium]